MKLLRTLDMKDYAADMPVLEVHAARAIILRDGKYAMQLGKSGEYKIPGGRLEPGETILEALIREVQEETGLLVRPESVIELGEIVEKRRDAKDASRIYVCHSYYFSCSVEEKTGETHMTQKELEKGFHLVWAGLDEMIEQNERLYSRENFPEARRRDIVFLKMLRDGEISYTQA